MKRLSALLTLVLCLSASSFARQKLDGFCEQGNKTVTTSGLTSTTKVQQSYPSCTVTIYLAGTVTPATLYSDNAGTPKANPLTADTNGYWFAYADNGRYDKRYSSGGIASPFTYGDALLDDNAETTLTQNQMAFNATPTFDAALYSSFTMTLSGNITSSSIANAKSGRLIALSFCQDGVGGRTVSWPPSFDSVPVIDQRVSKCFNSTWLYNGSKWKMVGQGGDSLGLAANSVITNGTAVLTLPTSSDTLVGRNTTDTLTNKTLSAATLSGITNNTGTISGGILSVATISGVTVNSGTLSGGTYASPTITDPTFSGTMTGTLAGTPTFSGQVIFSAATPFTITNNTLVGNLNSDLLDGTDWRAPGAIGAITPGAATFTTLTANTSVTSPIFKSSTTNPASAGLIELAKTDALNFRNNANGADINGISLDGSDFVLLGGTTGVKFAGPIGKVNNVATVSNGVFSEVAAVNLTAQTAANTTATLYSVTTAGQYRLSWNAKVTTAAGTSSTLGALTIVYTDPDNTVQTIVAPAAIAAGTIATTSTGNTTATVLNGLPLMLNCKAGTNVTWAFAYASNAANAMAYSIHLKLESD